MTLASTPMITPLSTEADHLDNAVEGRSEPEAIGGDV